MAAAVDPAVIPTWTSPILLTIIAALLSVIWANMRSFMSEIKADIKSNAVATAMNNAATAAANAKIEILERQMDKISEMGHDVSGLKYAIMDYLNKGKA